MKLESIGKIIGEFQVKSPWAFIAVFALILMITVPGIPLLTKHIEPSLEKILPQDISEVKLMNNMRSQFGADMMYLVITVKGPIYDVRGTGVVSYLDILANNIRDNEHILEVTSIADIVKRMNNGVIPDSNQEIKNILKIDPETLMYVNHDYSIAVMQIKSDTGASSEVISKVVSQLEHDITFVEEYNPGVSVQITGFNAIDKATFEVIISDSDTSLKLQYSKTGKFIPRISDSLDILETTIKKIHDLELNS